MSLSVDPQRVTLPSSDLDAEHYTKCSRLQRSLADTILDRIEDLATKARAYDIGCGDGAITAVLATRMPNGRVTGVDISPNMIAHATQTFSKLNAPQNIDFHLENAELFSPSQDQGNRPDLITSFSAFHWVRKPEKTLRKLCSSITPDGDLVILTYVNSDYYQFLQNTLIKYYPQYEHQSAYSTMFSADEYRRVLLDCGMEIKEFESENLIATAENEQAVKDFIQGWLASFVSLPEKEHTRFLDLAMKESLPYRLPSNDGKIHLPYTKLILRAKKEASVASKL